MRAEAKLFLYGVCFYLLVAVIYGAWSKDIAGFVLLVFTGCLAFLTGFFLWHTSRKVFPRPEDREDANIDEADSDYGFYSPHSWWPLPVGLSCAMIVFGFVFAIWIVVAGVACLFLSLIGFVFEYYRGDHAH